MTKQRWHIIARACQNNSINIYIYIYIYIHIILYERQEKEEYNITQLIRERERERKRTCRLVDFVVPKDHKTKRKESEKIGKHLDLIGELFKMGGGTWNMIVTVIPIIVGVLGTVPRTWRKD